MGVFRPRPPAVREIICSSHRHVDPRQITPADVRTATNRVRLGPKRTPKIPSHERCVVGPKVSKNRVRCALTRFLAAV
jgi:hypothetical protein